VFVTYTGFLSAGILSNSCFMPAFVAYSLPATLFVMARLISGSEPAFETLAIIVVFYYLAILGFSKNTNRIFMESIKWNKVRDSLVDELRQQKETAEQAVKAKSNFLASASHDLRQPLHALGLFHDALRYRIKEPESLEIMDKVSRSTQALNELLHSMLDISKLDASVVENNPKNIHLKSFLQPIFAEFNARAKDKGLRFNTSVEDSLYVYADSILFERVIRNLIDNAVKYTEKGSVGIVAYQLNDCIDINIVDTGIGIPDDQLENVFSEFNQLGNPERDKQKGLGLGLSIVKRLCVLMDVDIDLQSQEGKGSEVVVSVPSGGQTIETSTSYTDSISAGESTVLIIEDDIAILDGMSLLLETFGFNVLKAITSKQAMRASSEVRPDLIIADYRLPGNEDGLELIDAVRAYHLQYIPAILVTGDTAPERIKITESADVIVLHKPVDPSILEETIEKALR
jgi:signal transduction histidine kinase